MPKCSECGEEVPDGELVTCSECGRAYCKSCAAEEPSMAELGVCPDCEEAWGSEVDLEDEE
jgi:hypothetical protein